MKLPFADVTCIAGSLRTSTHSQSISVPILILTTWRNNASLPFTTWALTSQIPFSWLCKLCFQKSGVHKLRKILHLFIFVIPIIDRFVSSETIIHLFAGTNTNKHAQTLCSVRQNISHFITVCINREVTLVLGVQNCLIPAEKVVCKPQNNYHGLYVTDAINPVCCCMKVQISDVKSCELAAGTSHFMMCLQPCPRFGNSRPTITKSSSFSPGLLRRGWTLLPLWPMEVLGCGSSQ